MPLHRCSRNVSTPTHIWAQVTMQETHCDHGGLPLLVGVRSGTQIQAALFITLERERERALLQWRWQSNSEHLFLWEQSNMVIFRLTEQNYMMLNHTIYSDKRLNSSLCLINQIMKMHCGSVGIAPRILNLSTRWRWVVSFTSQPLYSRGQESPSFTHCIGGWVGPRAGMDAVAKRKKVPSLPLPGTEPPSSSP
jgi:hypothetical protein